MAGVSFLFLLGMVGLVLGVPTAMWFKTWPDALDRWLPREEGGPHDGTRLRIEGPPVDVRLAALASWILGTMFVPGLLLGVIGLFVGGVGIVSVPGLILAWQLFFLGAPLLRAEPEAARKARGLARFARILNYVVLGICAGAVGLQLFHHPGHSDLLAVLAGALSIALYAGVSLTHASLLDRAADAIDAQHGARPNLGGNVRLDVSAATASPDASAEEDWDEGSEAERRGRRG